MTGQHGGGVTGVCASGAREIRAAGGAGDTGGVGCIKGWAAG